MCWLTCQQGATYRIIPHDCLRSLAVLAETSLETHWKLASSWLVCSNHGGMFHLYKYYHCYVKKRRNICEVVTVNTAFRRSQSSLQLCDVDLHTLDRGAFSKPTRRVMKPFDVSTTEDFRAFTPAYKILMYVGIDVELAFRAVGAQYILTHCH
ncbi:hypothetical protein PHLGIDRAFT_393864 [Phlebiopsis gigantea 11061_1 CR5-6]|uniref:Uncharacterized protein n=1 Tax=Phlebiopsis gigantea (strain 11061_1 CR5-6) TaxID=745531 RepID=A0A0C3SBK2_PHLG1|nr:hypothetical protein PHLGIDRAFT_393864 [Phlebiopsis gigantea 11061_1 CR5-6]